MEKRKNILNFCRRSHRGGGVGPYFVVFGFGCIGPKGIDTLGNKTIVDKFPIIGGGTVIERVISCTKIIVRVEQKLAGIHKIEIGPAIFIKRGPNRDGKMTMERIVQSLNKLRYIWITRGIKTLTSIPVMRVVLPILNDIIKRVSLFTKCFNCNKKVVLGRVIIFALPIPVRPFRP